MKKEKAQREKKKRSKIPKQDKKRKSPERKRKRSEQRSKQKQTPQDPHHEQAPVAVVLELPVCGLLDDEGDERLLVGQIHAVQAGHLVNALDQGQGHGHGLAEFE